MKNEKTINLLLGMLDRNIEVKSPSGHITSLNDSFMFRIRGGQINQNNSCDNTGCNNDTCTNKNCTNDSNSNTSCTNTGCKNSACFA